MDYKGLEHYASLAQKFQYEETEFFFYILKYDEIPSIYRYGKNDDDDDDDDDDYIIPRNKRTKKNQVYDIDKIISKLKEKYSIEVLQIIRFVDEGIDTVSSAILNFTDLHFIFSIYKNEINKFNLCYDHKEYSTIEDIKAVTKDFFDILNDCITDKIRKKMSVYILDKDSYSMKVPFSFDEKINLEKHYNDGFVDVDNTINNWIQDTSKNGLIILNGEKGSGKSTYIKYLISKHYKHSDFIYVTSSGLASLSRKGMSTIIDQFNGKTIILEDCETLLKDRDRNEADPEVVPMLLNITDGILSNLCKCKIILTFNTQISKIDSALLRKGRCFMQYQFNKLSEVKTLELLAELGITPTEEDLKKKGLTLAEIFYHENNNAKINKENKKIGFI